MLSWKVPELFEGRRNEWVWSDSYWSPFQNFPQNEKRGCVLEISKEFDCFFPPSQPLFLWFLMHGARNSWILPCLRGTRLANALIKYQLRCFKMSHPVLHVSWNLGRGPSLSPPKSPSASCHKADCLPLTVPSTCAQHSLPRGHTPPSPPGFVYLRPPGSIHSVPSLGSTAF